MDIKIAFFHDLHEKVYVPQQSSFVVSDQERKVCKLHKALYGLKQALRVWYEKINAYLINQGFKNNPTKSTPYVKECDGVLIILALYVDNMVVIGSDEQKNSDFKMNLWNGFEMSNLGLVHNYVGVQFMQTEESI